MDYVYKSEFEECVPEIQASTTLNELDELEIINRNSDEFNKIPTIDNPYPDILKKPLFTRTIPESVPVEQISEPIIIKGKSLKEMSIKEFSSIIANSLIEILNDILKFDPTRDNFTEIFTKDSRILAIGVLLLIISVFFIFFKNVD
jgi:hypothetical protein